MHVCGGRRSIGPIIILNSSTSLRTTALCLSWQRYGAMLKKQRNELATKLLKDLMSGSLRHPFKDPPITGPLLPLPVYQPPMKYSRSKNLLYVPRDETMAHDLSPAVSSRDSLSLTAFPYVPPPPPPATPECPSQPLPPEFPIRTCTFSLPSAAYLSTDVRLLLNPPPTPTPRPRPRPCAWPSSSSIPIVPCHSLSHPKSPVSPPMLVPSLCVYLLHVCQLFHPASELCHISPHPQVVGTQLETVSECCTAAS